MNGSFLLDTNILVYAYDRSEMTKKLRATSVLDWLESHAAGALSTQILGEFFWAVTRRLAEPLTVADGSAQLRKHMSVWTVLIVTPQIVLEAARGAVEFNLPYWDAQIWATAKLNQILCILSEDFSHGSRIEGVQFVNPFVAALPGEE